MKRIISLLSTILLASTICSAQVQYCGSEPSSKSVQNYLLRSEEFDNPLKVTPFQGNQTGTNIDINQSPLTPYRGSSN